MYFFNYLTHIFNNNSNENSDHRERAKIIDIIKYYLLENSFILFLFLLSSNDATAQIAAGNQAITVICKIKQQIACIIFPLKKKDKHGNKTAIKIIIFLYF